MTRAPVWKSRVALRVVIAWLAAMTAFSAASVAQQPIEFNRTIRPILSERCFTCHGPDSVKRKADLRFDQEASAKLVRDGGTAIVPGSPETSTLYQRITSQDPAERMPPPESGDPLTPAQQEAIKEWIKSGAVWQQHWSLIPPKRPALPGVTQTNWPRNGIDHFVLHRLGAAGLTPNPLANRETLIRRVTLDLTGLPPTPAEIDAFLNDSSPDAYEKVVDRLLASPGYGEHMAVPWLDAARYADTNGYQTDAERYMWRWRDWVIESLNSNMPFDQFTIEQLAGDLLPTPTMEQRIATGFNRNHRGNAEGGVIEAEYAVEYVVDRVDTTSTVWLGVTMGCCRCHDHKYDPFTQKDFYQLFAFFNNVPERGKAVKYGNSPPMLIAPTREQSAEQSRLQAAVHSAARNMEALEPKIQSAQQAWEQSHPQNLPADWSIAREIKYHFALDGSLDNQCSPPADTPAAVTTIAYVPGQIGQALSLEGKGGVELGNVADFGYYDRFTIAAWIYPTTVQGTQGIVSKMSDDAYREGYSLDLVEGKLQVNLVKRWLDDALRVETTHALSPNAWHHVLATYDGTRVLSAVKVYIDGQSVPIVANLDELNQTFTNKYAFRIGSAGTQFPFSGKVDDVRIWGDCLTEEEIGIAALAAPAHAILQISPDKRTKAEQSKLRTFFMEQVAEEPLREARRSLATATEQLNQLVRSFPTVMVMEELATPRPSHILTRGQYDQPAEPVQPDVPSVLPAFPAGQPRNRLGLARWLVSGDHPLTARVTVNRIWQQHFGQGLVKTTEDFGSQGDAPVHQELLDWLSVDFVESGWNLKGLHRMIVMSSTYQQAASLSSAQLARDPENRLFGRAPRIRLSAEMLRDQALATSGLLVHKLGGPSVYPYQPAGLWSDLSAPEDYVQGHGESIYRRSMYTFWKRTIAPPSMMVFDASARETCQVRMSRTNTPTQALTLMNDVTYVETARKFAERVLQQGGTDLNDRLRFAFRLQTARYPQDTELAVLRHDLERHLSRFQSQPEAAMRLLSVGESPRDAQLDAAELAAYTMLGTLLQNLDEVVTRP